MSKNIDSKLCFYCITSTFFCQVKSLTFESDIIALMSHSMIHRRYKMTYHTPHKTPQNPSFYRTAQTEYISPIVLPIPNIKNALAGILSIFRRFIHRLHIFHADSQLHTDFTISLLNWQPRSPETKIRQKNGIFTNSEGVGRGIGRQKGRGSHDGRYGGTGNMGVPKIKF